MKVYSKEVNKKRNTRMIKKRKKSKKAIQISLIDSLKYIVIFAILLKIYFKQ